MTVSFAPRSSSARVKTPVPAPISKTESSGGASCIAHSAMRFAVDSPTKKFCPKRFFGRSPDRASIVRGLDIPLSYAVSRLLQTINGDCAPAEGHRSTERIEAEIDSPSDDVAAGVARNRDSVTRNVQAGSQWDYSGIDGDDSVTGAPSDRGHPASPRAAGGIRGRNHQHRAACDLRHLRDTARFERGKRRRTDAARDDAGLCRRNDDRRNDRTMHASAVALHVLDVNFAQAGVTASDDFGTPGFEGRVEVGDGLRDDRTPFDAIPADEAVAMQADAGGRGLVRWCGRPYGADREGGPQKSGTEYASDQSEVPFFPESRHGLQIYTAQRGGR